MTFFQGAYESGEEINSMYTNDYENKCLISYKYQHSEEKQIISRCSIFHWAGQD